MMAAKGIRKIKLKEVCDRITVGHVGPMADRYTAAGVPFLRSQNITAFRLNLDDIKFVPPDFHEKLRNSALLPGHENFPRVGVALGDILQGWELCTLDDFVQFKSGFAFKSGTFTADGEHRLVTIRNVQDGAFNPESDSRMSELPQNLPPYCVL